jgi:hypothetical protein
VKSQSDGTFEFQAVTDGEWHLFATSQRDGVSLEAAKWIEMSGHEIEGVKLRLSPPFTVTGKIVMETPQGMSPPEKLPSINLWTYVGRQTPETGVYQRAWGAPVDEGGGFSIKGVYPGVYKVGGTGSPGYYLDAIRVAETEVTMTQNVDFSGPASITLVYKGHGGTVRGTVKNCASGTVVLVPQGTPTSEWRRGSFAT